MSFLSILAFTAVNASRQGHAKIFAEQPNGAGQRVDMRFELIMVVVASKDALQARRALLVCPDTAIVRCLPMHKDDRVELKIRFPAGQGDTVIDRILACLPHGEIGGVVVCATPHARSRASHSSVVQLHGF
jgi:hypothetical protein